MKYTTKMLLVPENTVRDSVPETRKTGIENQVTEFRKALLNILSDVTITPETQMQLYSQLFNRYTKLDRESKEPPTVIVQSEEPKRDTVAMENAGGDENLNHNKWENDIFHSIPKIFKKKAEMLVNVLKDSSNFSVNPQGEIIINNQRLPNTHIVDLVNDVIRDRPSHEAPQGQQEFLQFLKNLNIPKEYIGNKNRKKQIQVGKPATPAVKDDAYFTPSDVKKRLDFPEKTATSSKKKPKRVKKYEGWD